MVLLKTAFVFLAAQLLAISMASAETISAKEALETKVVKSKIIATLKAGFHFNEKAPNAVEIDGKRSEPVVLSRQKITFQLPTTFTLAKASVFVCDDALTFCEPQTIEFHGTAEAVAYMSARAEVKRAEPKDMKRKKAKINKHGFIEDDLDRAVETASKSKSLILADFSARWCPGCLRLENEILGTKEFKKTAKSFVKVRLDYDRFENLPLKAKFGIYAIPTLLVLNSDLEEVSRLVDYQPLPVLTAFLNDANKNRASIAKLKAAADTGNSDANLAVAIRLYTANRFEESLPYFQKVKPEPIQYLDAKVNAAKKAAETDSDKKSDFLTVVHEALVQEPNSSRSLVWRTALVSMLSSATEKKTIATEGTQVADDLIAHPAKIVAATKGDFVGEFAGYERLLIAIERADLIEASGATEDEVKVAREKVVAVGLEAKVPVSKKGPALRLLIAMLEAKDYKAAEAQSRKLLKADPKNPELQRRLLRTLNGEEKFNEAVSVGRKAISKSYGKNEIWVAVQLAKAYVGNKQHLEARALARSYLGRTDIDWALMPAEQKDLQAIIQANL